MSAPSNKILSDTTIAGVKGTVPIIHPEMIRPKVYANGETER
ncbi:hypothetical protein [Paenibacillus tengchongensis]|nr:hypothetical protein [Paenibacillus tengchongensis]